VGQIKEGSLIKVPLRELFPAAKGLGRGGWIKGTVKEVENIKGQTFPLTARIEFFFKERDSTGKEIEKNINKKFTLAFIDEEEFDCCAGIEATAFMKYFTEGNPGRRIMVGFSENENETCGVYLALWQDTDQED